MMPYTKAQFVAYQVNTFPAAGIFGSFSQRYLGISNSEADIRFRCHLMRNAIKTAAASPHVVVSKSTLKIFMAPEFYFRGKEGAYPIEQVSTIMENLRTYVRSPRFGDWLFVFGTALGYLDDGTSKEVFNVAMVQRGGTDNTDASSCLIVYKELISHIDFIREGVKSGSWGKSKYRVGLIGKSSGSSGLLRPTRGSTDLNSKYVNKAGEGREKSRSGLGGQGIFTMNGITFGLEVCLDHLTGRLRKSPPATGDPLIQIHLIPSAGASIEEDAVACMKGGLIFNVDGNEDTQVDRNIGDHDDPNLQYAHYPNAIRILDDIDLDLSVVGSRWNSFFNSEGSILVFKEQGVPQARKK